MIFYEFFVNMNNADEIKKSLFFKTLFCLGYNRFTQLFEAQLHLLRFPRISASLFQQ